MQPIYLFLPCLDVARQRLVVSYIARPERRRTTDRAFNIEPRSETMKKLTSVLILAMVVLEFKFRSHQMDPTSTMLVEAVVDPGHQAHLLMLVMVD